MILHAAADLPREGAAGPPPRTAAPGGGRSARPACAEPLALLISAHCGR